MSFEALQERLSELQHTVNQLRELIDRLAKLEFQPGSVPLSASDEHNEAAELSSEINQVLAEGEEELEVLQEEITDLGRRSAAEAEQKARLKEGASRLETELESCRSYFRKAQLNARQSLQRARRLERQLLLASYAASALTSPQNRSGASSPAPGQPQNDASPQSSLSSPAEPVQLFTARDRRRYLQQARDRAAAGASGDGGAVSASGDVTAALRRTHALVSDSLARSEFARQTLADSTAALKQLQQSYAGLDDMLASSRDLLGVLLSSQKSDTWYLQTALYMLLATLAWLVFRRLLYAPMWWVVWLPLRLVWRTGGAVARVGGGDGNARMEVGRADGHGSRVVGMHEDGVVNTARVDEQERAPLGEPGSMMELLGRVVDGTAQEAAGRGDGSTSQAESGVEKRKDEKNEKRIGNGAENKTDEPNPMKRMWEEEKEQAREAERVRDEL